MTHFSTMHCLMFWFASFIHPFIQHMLNEEHLVCIKRVRQTLTFKNLFFLYISSQESYKKKNHLLFFTHVTTTPRKEAHTLAVPKTHQPYRSMKIGPCQTREVMGRSAWALSLHSNKCLKKCGFHVKNIHLPQTKSLNILKHNKGVKSCDLNRLRPWN